MLNIKSKFNKVFDLNALKKKTVSLKDDSFLKECEEIKEL